jgi:hypothetical protein
MAQRGMVTLGLLALLAPNGCASKPECQLVRYDASGQKPDTATTEPEEGDCTFYTYAQAAKDSVGPKPGGTDPGQGAGNRHSAAEVVLSVAVACGVSPTSS